MLNRGFLLFLAVLLRFILFGQVPDSTFGIPTSFEGHPDSYFAGVTSCDFDGQNDFSYDMFHLEDGRIILAGHTVHEEGTDFALVRLLPDGQYDESAGPEGEIMIDLGLANDSCLASTLHPDGYILMAGSVTPEGQTGYHGIITKVDYDGHLDPTFGEEGLVVLDLPGNYSMITQIHHLPNGKILVGGNAFYGIDMYFPDSTTVFVARLFSDGQIDSTFSMDGITSFPLDPGCESSILSDMQVYPDGRVLLSGGTYSPYPYNYDGKFWCSHEIHIRRLLANGSADNTFGENGIVVMANAEGRINDLYLDEQENILMAGIISDGLIQFSQSRLLFAKLLPNGTPDSTFANNGRYVESIFMSTLWCEPKSILKSGAQYYLSIHDTPSPTNTHVAFGLLRFSEDGSWDTSFGNEGVFSSWAWLPFFGKIEDIITIDDGQSIFMSGYHRLSTVNYKMMIAKIKLNTISSTPVLSEAKNIALALYPNPASETIQLNLNTSGEKEVVVINALGARVNQYRMSDQQMEIDISIWSKGVYFIMAYHNGQLLGSGRLVKQ
jgi:uncharacterized delta-60 repeat protein